MYVLICLLTIFVSSRADLMYDNITIVAGNEKYRMLVIGMTIFMAVFYALKVNKIFNKLSNDKKIYHVLITLTCLMMSIGAFFPYTIGGEDFLSKVHVFCSFYSCVLFLSLLFIYTRLLSIAHIELYLKIHYFYDIGIQFLALIFILFSRVNGYIEIMFAIFVSTYLYLIEKNDS